METEQCNCDICFNKRIAELQQYFEAESFIREPKKINTIKIKDTTIYAMVPWKSLYQEGKH